MRIGIDFHSVEREGTGNCTYIRSTVESLLEIDDKNEYFLYVVNDKYAYYEKFRTVKNVFLKPIGVNNPFVRIPLLGFYTFRDKIDILHVQYIAPPIFRGKLCLAIHDISFFHFPECFRRFEVYRQRLLLPLNIIRAQRILVSSQFSKKDLIDIYNVNGKQIEVVYCGVKSFFKPLADLENAKVIMKKYGIFDKFILFVGRLDTRKNLPVLFKTFNLLKQTKKIPHKLVIVGKKDYLSKHIVKELNSSPYKKDVIFTGFVEENSLVLFYNMADVFIYPSFYEGFGLPCLEAMASGCPVVSSNNSSLPEVVGSAGILIDPDSVEEIANAIHNIIADVKLRNNFVEKGINQAKRFDWKKSAIQLLEIYRGIVK